MTTFFAQTLAQVLEETSTNIATAMTLKHLEENGTITLEEATFYKTMASQVILESAEDFIPDTLNIPDAPMPQEVPEPMAPIELFDAVGNKYVFQDGQLVPVDSAEPEVPLEEELPPMEPEEELPPMEPEVPMEESTIVSNEEQFEESTFISEDSVVAKILNNLKSGV